MRISGLLACWALCLCGPEGFSQGCKRSELNAFGGYRNDTYTRVNRTAGVQSDTIDINNLNIWQVGVNGRFMMPGFKDSFVRNFFVNGFAYWGWKAGASELVERVKSYAGAGVQKGKAHVDSVNTTDFQAGLGYLFEWESWNFGLSSGYAWDNQTIETNSGKISYPAGSPYVDAPLYGSGYKTATKWRGPWVGADVEYSQCSWRTRAGYEFHIASFSAKHTIPNNFIARLQGVDSYANASQAYGNVAFFDGDYRYCEWGKIGAGFTYQHWQALHGDLSSQESSLDAVPSSTTTSSSARWTAYGANINLGFVY